MPEKGLKRGTDRRKPAAQQQSTIDLKVFSARIEKQTGEPQREKGIHASHGES